MLKFLIWEFVRVDGGGGGEGEGRKGQLFREELPALAKEVARVETVRAYAGDFFFLHALRYGNVN